MTTICRIIGGAGTGKTSHLMNVLTQWLERDENPFSIGFASFTRAARGEAAMRAAAIAGVGQDELQQAGWFRTIHSLAYKQLGAGKELLVADKDSRKWVAQALGVAPDATDVADAEEEPACVAESASDETNALAIWEFARARLIPLAAAWDTASAINEFVPDWEFVRGVVERYEQMKRLDGRQDFSDLLGRFSGVRFGLDGHDLTAPCEGAAPPLKIWFFDEWQDATLLMDRCARRVAESAEVVYIAGDPFQSIYSFSGSSPTNMMGWTPTAGKERILRQSYRCPRAIQNLGEDVLRECSDYWDREIKPRDEEGDVHVELLGSSWVDEIDPKERWGIIARSNAHAKRLIAKIDAAGLPWLPTKGHGGKWAAPVRNIALRGLISLEEGHAIADHEWSAALKFLPSKTAEGEIITRGAKAAWERMDRSEGEMDRLNDLEHLPAWGAAPQLLELIRSGRWTRLIDNGLDFRDAWKRYGHEAVLNPNIHIGTIHSVKGAEFDHVVLLTTTSRQCSRAMDFEETADEERRVAYVGVTRARKTLTVLKEKCLHQMELPL